MSKEEKRRVIGIDPSLGGFAAYRCDGQFWESQKEKLGDGVEARADRLDEILDAFIDWVAEYDPHVIVVEGYYGQMSQNSLRLLELGWQLRYTLVRHKTIGAMVFEVAPATMKKIVVGKGNAKKAKVASELAVKHGITFDNDNLADAFGLLQVGLMIAKEIPTKHIHTSAIKKILKAAI